MLGVGLTPALPGATEPVRHSETTTIRPRAASPSAWPRRSFAVDASPRRRQAAEAQPVPAALAAGRLYGAALGGVRQDSSARATAARHSRCVPPAGGGGNRRQPESRDRQGSQRRAGVRGGAQRARLARHPGRVAPSHPHNAGRHRTLAACGECASTNHLCTHPRILAAQASTPQHRRGTPLRLLLKPRAATHLDACDCGA
mmetsp:Transcript_8688/g.21448  ORF Transcript_8688/g.21448 Transcript_8688/m.21448 type:complete len:201 (+) Transcript_8688:232-834(+)